jgi:hypothetical protein
MQKPVVVIASLVLFHSAAGWAQLGTTPPLVPSTNSQPSTQTNQPPAGGTLTFTNQSGQTFTLADLDQQLQDLRASVEQTLTMLAAVNTNLSSASLSGRVGSSIGSILEGVLSKDRRSDNNATPNESSSGVSNVGSNVVGLLQGLFNTNATRSATVNAATLNELRRLQSELEPIPGILQALNVAPGPNNSRLDTVADPTLTNNPSQSQPPGGLSPTGR